MICTITRTKEAQPCGVYKRTALDDAKDAADFRMVACWGHGKTDIVWKDGRMETVTERQLEKLQKTYTSACDF